MGRIFQSIGHRPVKNKKNNSTIFSDSIIGEAGCSKDWKHYKHTDSMVDCLDS